MASKFGGIEITEEESIGSKFGGVPIQQKTAPAKPVAMTGWQSPRTATDAAIEGVTNIPSSAVQLGKDLWNVVSEPGKTFDTMSDVAGGYLQKGVDVLGLDWFGITASPENKRPYADMVNKAMSERYGGSQEILNTLATDPVGMLGDLAAVQATAGGALRSVGKTGSVVSDVGKVLTEAGTLVDPMAMAGTAIGKGVKFVGNAGQASRNFLGVITGAGTKSIERAVAGNPKFIDAIRGRLTESDIVQVADEALAQFKQNRRTNYTDALEDVMKQVDVLDDGTVVAKQLDITPVREAFGDMLSNDSYSVGRNADGSLNFDRSTLRYEPKAKEIIQNIDELLSEWGTDVGDLTPIGVDKLKRTLDSMFAESDVSHTIIAEVRGKVRDVLVDKVDGYAEMTADYQQATDFIKEMERTLSLKGGTADTKMRKLTQAVKDDFKARGQLLDTIDAELGTSLVDMIAGNQMNAWMAKNMVGRFAGMAAAGFAVGKGISKEVIASLLSSSPKVVGTTLSALGAPKSAIKKFIKQRPKLLAQFNAINKAIESGTATTSSVARPLAMAGVRANQATGQYDQLINQRQPETQ